MSSVEINTNQAKKAPFLAEPSELSELNGWISEYVRHRERLTFDEQDVLLKLWQEGEDVRLREDRRFRQIQLPFREDTESQWYLATHTVANQPLYELLLDELWDGRNLFQRLEDCDKKDKAAYHVFCSKDPRFHLYKDESGTYRVSLREATTHIALTTEQKTILDQLAPQFMGIMENDKGTPYTTTHLLETLQKLSTVSDALVGMLPPTRCATRFHN